MLRRRYCFFNVVYCIFLPFSSEKHTFIPILTCSVVWVISSSSSVLSIKISVSGTDAVPKNNNKNPYVHLFQWIIINSIVLTYNLKKCNIGNSMLDQRSIFLSCNFRCKFTSRTSHYLLKIEALNISLRFATALQLFVPTSTLNQTMTLLEEQWSKMTLAYFLPPATTCWVMGYGCPPTFSLQTVNWLSSSWN